MLQATVVPLSDKAWMSFMDFRGKEKGMAIKAKEDRKRGKQRENRGVYAMVTHVFSLFQAAGRKF